jgi:nucleoside-diphosphate-sugar epimerase
MTVTVIGGSGFIGTYLCKRLAEKSVSFEIIDLKKSELFPERTKIADIRDIHSLRKAVSGAVIVHLAALHRDDVKDTIQYYETNVDGTRNVCAVAAEKGVSNVVFTSTVAVYGFAPPETGEDGAIVPFNDYERSKYQAEGILR